jgi:hypothetical protein
MGLFASFFFGKDKTTLEAMKEDRLRRIEELKAEIAEIDALIEKAED